MLKRLGKRKNPCMTRAVVLSRAAIHLDSTFSLVVQVFKSVI